MLELEKETSVLEDQLAESNSMNVRSCFPVCEGEVGPGEKLSYELKTFC